MGTETVYCAVVNFGKETRVESYNINTDWKKFYMKISVL